MPVFCYPDIIKWSNWKGLWRQGAALVKACSIVSRSNILTHSQMWYSLVSCSILIGEGMWSWPCTGGMGNATWGVNAWDDAQFLSIVKTKWGLSRSGRRLGGGGGETRLWKAKGAKGSTTGMEDIYPYKNPIYGLDIKLAIHSFTHMIRIKVSGPCMRILAVVVNGFDTGIKLINTWWGIYEPS